MISLNCLGRAEADDLQSVLPALAEVAERVEVPQARLGVVLDWVQYRRSFRDPVVVRRFLSNGAGPYAQVALDMRRVRELDREALVAAIVGRLSPGNGERLFLEDWVAPSKSVMWAFNRSYWRHLSAWDTTFEKDYSAALPGGVSDGTNPAFWRERIEAFVKIPDPSAVRVAPSVDLDLGEVLARLPEWTRVHLSSVAVESLAQTLELLHPEGVLQLQDLFVRDVGEYSSFLGPGKIEGSIVNWLNGPLFQMVGERLGFHAALEPFTHREGSNIVVLTARRRDASSDERLLASDEELLSARAAA